MSISTVTPITRDSILVDPESGKPTQLFLQIWTTLVNLKLVDLADFSGTPANGDTLVYNGATKQWEPQ